MMLLILSTESGGLGIADTATEIYGKADSPSCQLPSKRNFRGGNVYGRKK